MLAIATAAPSGAAPLVPAGPQARDGAGAALEELGLKTLDAVVVRPLGAAASAAGLAFFLASLPLVAPARQIGTSWEIFVLAPVDYTFLRPLGDL